MDSKRVYKKISTIFWFMLATFPLWFSAICAIFSYFLHLENNDGFNALAINDGGLFSFGNNNFFGCLKNIISQNKPLANFTPYFIRNMFVTLFYNGFSIQLTDTTYALAYSFAWFCWVYMLEIMVDVFVWLPRWMHDILEKGVGKID